MKLFPSRLAVLPLVASVVFGFPVLHAAEVQDLFAGNDLSKHWETTGNWALSEGVATLTPRPGESGWSRWSAYLWSKNTYKDFEIEFDYLLQPKGNSGFYFHVGDRNDPVKKGIEVQIFDSASFPPEKPLNDHDSGGMIPGIPPTKRAAKPAGEWNHFRIVVKAGKVTVHLNGELVNEVPLDHARIKDRPESGYIGFQDHGLPLSIRNVRLTGL